MSVDTGGSESNDHSGSPAISADGRYVAFASRASDLVPSDTNTCADVFVRDLAGGTIERVSLDASGADPDGASEHPALSADGRYVAFASRASDLVPSDTNTSSDVFVRDMVSQITRRVSVDSAGRQASGHSSYPSISADGRYVAFQSWAYDLVANDTTSGRSDVFVHDRLTGDTIRVSVSSTGTAGNQYSEAPDISADGRYVAFASDASNLVTGDATHGCDVFVRDLQTGVTTRVSIDSSGTAGDADSASPSLSGDGRYVAFDTFASNLGSDGSALYAQVVVHDRFTGKTEMASVDPTGGPGDGYSKHPSISADGRHVAFDSVAADLVAGDTTGCADIFIRDLESDSTTLVSVAADSGLSDGSSWAPCITADGEDVAFESVASNLVLGDFNFCKDVFVRTSVPVDTEPPASVTALTAVGGAHSIALSWSNPTTDFAATRLFQSRSGYATNPTGGPGQTLLTEGILSRCTDTGLEAGVTYFYTAFARDVAYNWSAPATVAGEALAAADVTAPDRVSGFSVRSGSRWCALGWSNPTSDYAATRILRSTTAHATGPTPGGSQALVFEGPSTELTDTAVANGATYFYTGYARDAAENWSEAATGSGVPTWTSTSLSCDASTTLVPYGGKTVVFATLLGPLGSLPAQTVGLYRASYHTAPIPTYVYAGDAAYDPAAGTYRATVSLVSNTAFRLAFQGNEDAAPSTSRRVVVASKALMYQPRMSSYTPKMGQTFTVSNCFRPGHAGKTVIEFQHGNAGRWATYRWYAGTNTRVSSTLTSCVLRTRLASVGRWRLRARHWDSGHALSYSAWRYFQVR